MSTALGATLMVILELALLLVGMGLFLRAAVGSFVLAPPRCARCSHDLRTFGEPPAACPECGQDCRAPGAVSFSRRRRRASHAVLGLVLMAAAAIIPLAIAASVAARASTMGAAQSVAPLPSVSEFLARAKDGGDVDWGSLPQILRTGQPTPEELDAVVAAVEQRGGVAAMGLTMHQRHAVDDAGATLLKRMDETDIDRLAKAWVGPVVVAAPERVAVGESWAVLVQGQAAADAQVLGRTREGLTRSANPFVAAVRVTAVRIDGVDVAAVVGSPQPILNGALAWIPIPASSRPSALTLEVDVCRAILRADDLPGTGLPEDPSQWPPAIVEENSTTRAVVQVVAQGEDVVTRSTDAALRERMAEALRVTACRIEGEGAARRLVVETTIVPPGGVSIAGRWRLRIGERIVDMGLISAWGKPTNFAVNGQKRLLVPLGSEESPEVIDVLIEPASEAATVLPRHGTPAWGEVIERRAVRVDGR